MTNSEFAHLLHRFAGQPIPATSVRHVYLWHDELAQLLAVMPAGLAVYLDLYALTAGLPRRPLATDEARKVLQAVIRLWLHDNVAAAGSQQVVVVTGVSLLARYRASVNDFFQVANDTCMFVFVISPQETSFQPVRPFPAYIQVRPQATLEFLQAALGTTAIVGATGA